MMNPVEREQVRLSILRHLAANPTKYGITARLLRQYLGSEGQRLTDAEMQSEIQYLVDKGLVVETTKILSPENMAWRIVAAGRDYLAEVQGE